MSRNALITGGTRGIGAAIAVAMKHAGYNVAVNYARNVQAAEAFHKETGVPTVQWDVSDFDASAKGLTEVEEKIGPIDVLVNNAGVTRDAFFAKMSLDQWRDVIDANLTGLFNVTRNIWEGMMKRRFGRVIAISSVNAQRGQAGQTNYAAAKAGELGFIKALAQEGARYGITANAICPGYIDTDMVRVIPEEILKTKVLPQIPVGRLGEPREIARAVLFLVSEDASFVTGSTLSVNGGMLMS